MIKTTNLNKTYNKNKANQVHALKDVNICINKGEMVALMGTSGAGKSTLLHVIGCVERFESGSYEIDGVNVSDYSNNKIAKIRNTKLGFVIQDFALVQEYSVIENVMIPLFFSGDKKKQRKQKSLEALEKVGILELAHRPVTQLSGGQKQRVAIARSIVNNPDILLADEPTGALDSKTSDEILNVFKQLNSFGKTIVIVTHDNSVAKVCERTINISDGEIVN